MGKKKEQKVEVYRRCPRCGKYIEVEGGKLKRHTHLVSGKECEGE